MEYINGSELANKRFIQLENGDLREAPKGKFVPEIGERYYCLECFGNVRCLKNEGKDEDKWLLKHNLVFSTYEECEDYKHFLEVLDEYTFEPDWEDPSQEKWAICFNRMGHRIDWLRLCSVQYRCPCFESYEKAMAFIDAVGTEAVERYMLDYWR